ncbi:MAG TPA: hypothetical protein VF600_17525 [Abditibacteriaceae bacterium]|jgi:hypothetical protein
MPQDPTQQQETINNLLQQELSRKEFLQYLGAAVLAVAGIASIKQALLSPSGQKTVQSPTPKRVKFTNNYSSGSYGGKS